jgi:transposase
LTAIAFAISSFCSGATLFRSGRHLAAWLGLVPRQHSTGGKAKLGRITKMGDKYLRKLLIVGMTAVIRSARRTKAPAFAWVNALLERPPSAPSLGGARQQGGPDRLGDAGPR